MTLKGLPVLPVFKKAPMALHLLKQRQWPPLFICPFKRMLNSCLFKKSFKTTPLASSSLA